MVSLPIMCRLLWTELKQTYLVGVSCYIICLHCGLKNEYCHDQTSQISFSQTVSPAGDDKAWWCIIAPSSRHIV